MTAADSNHSAHLAPNILSARLAIAHMSTCPCLGSDNKKRAMPFTVDFSAFLISAIAHHRFSRNEEQATQTNNTKRTAQTHSTEHPAHWLSTLLMYKARLHSCRSPCQGLGVWPPCLLLPANGARHFAEASTTYHTSLACTADDPFLTTSQNKSW
eukprot:4791408-Amphidinium_carterae.1